MYDTGKILESQKKTVTKEYVLSKISEYDIYAKYMGNFKIGALYKSPLREDKNPSFKVYIGRDNGRLFFKDFSTGEGGDVFKFVKIKENLSRYSEVAEMLGMENASSTAKRQEYKPREKTKIAVQRRQWTKEDLAYWDQFGITKEILEKYKVSPIEKMFSNGILKLRYSKENPMYCYKVFNSFKIYRPLGNKTEKWRGNLDQLDVQGFEQLEEKTSTLIITKALKDVMTLRSYNYDAIAPTSESSMLDFRIIKYIRHRYKNIIILYDRDKTGMQYSRKMVKEFGLDFRFINKKFKCKDISDFVKKYGKEKGKELLSEMINTEAS